MPSAMMIDLSYRERIPCCLAGCLEPCYARGLCEQHYDRSRYLIREKFETWESLEKRKLAKPRSMPAYDMTLEQRIEAAVLKCLTNGMYPTASLICQHMGRISSTLRGSECKLRDAIFKKHKIKKRRSKLNLPDRRSVKCNVDT
jgi:hypothetical protein